MKKIMKLVCTCFLVLSLSACGEAIEDTNGENNTSLNTITKEEIVGNSITSSGLGYSESNSMGITSFEYQAKNFIFDISNSEISIENVINQINKIYKV